MGATCRKERGTCLGGGLLAGALLAVPGLAAAAVTLKIATISPDGTTWMTRMRAAAEEIAARTERRVGFKFYPGGVMGNDETVMRKIRIGQLHGGAITGGSLAEIDPDSRIYGLPLLFRSYAEVDYVRARMDARVLQGLERNGYVSFGLADGGFAYLLSAQPIRSIDDLRARKVWAPPNEPISRVLFETAGLAPIPLPLSDVLTGLQTGLIDTVGVSPVGAIALQWHTKTRYFTDTPLFYLFGTLIVDRKTFQKISAADRAVVREVMERAFKDIDRQNRADNASAREALRRQGIEFVNVGPEALTRWHDVAREARARLARMGLYSPPFLEAVQEHLAAYRRRHPDAPTR